MADLDAEPPRSPSAEKSPTDVGRPLLNWPVAVAAILLGLVVILGGGALVMRQVTGAASPEVPASSTPIVSAAPTTAQVPTAQPPTLVPTTIAPAATSAKAVPTATTLSTSAVKASTSVAPATNATNQEPAPTPIPDAKSTAVGASSAPTPSATIAPEIAREIEQAYSHYWDVTASAFWDLDTAHLNEVSTGEELAFLTQDISQLRTDGKAIRTEVRHQYFVVSANEDDATVFDRFRDFSVYVDPNSKQPLPGQERPSSADDAPLNSILYHLHKVDGVWKIAKGDRYANQ